MAYFWTKVQSRTFELGVLIDTGAFARRGELELWILRQSDVVPL